MNNIRNIKMNKVTGTRMIKGDWITFNIQFPNGTKVTAELFKHDINPKLLSPVVQYGKIFNLFKDSFKKI